ncbi:insulinase family protein [bacterium]|nr:insulinase family protein [bacterium]
MKKLIVFYLVFVFLGLSFGICQAAWVDNVNKTKLSNGLTIITREDHSLPIVAIQVWIRAGSINEDKYNNGVSHFIEHMLFKGTSRREAGEVGKEIAIRGGNINAGTAKDFTYYHIVIPSEHFKISLDILGDILTNATFPREELERERLVVLEEIKRSYDNPSSHLWNLLNETLYISSPYRFRVLGNEEGIKNMNRKTLFEYYQKFYVPSNMCITVVGDFKTKKIIRDIKKTFNVRHSSFSKEKTARENYIPINIQSKKQEIEIKKKIKQTYLNIGFLGPDIKSKDQYAMDLLAYILGKGRSSRLYRQLREKKKLVWNIESGFLTQKGQGPFVVSAFCEFTKIQKVRDEVLGEIAKIKDGALGEKELNKAKIMLESDYFFNNETFANQAFSLGYYETLDTCEFLQSYLEQITKITIADIVEVANKYLDLNKYTLVVIRPDE